MTKPIKRNRQKPVYTRNARRRRQQRQGRATVWLLAICIAAFLGVQYLLGRQKAKNHAQIYDGNFTSVVTAPGLDEILIDYTGMTVSFNPTLHIPNWVAWELTAEEAAGTESRAEKFFADDRVKGSATPSDYTRSGYDRGHMAPAGDMKWDSEAMAETFYMTNICPQAGVLNRGSWKKLEEKCRARVRRDSAVVIVCGPVLTDPAREYIGQSQVAVPERFFKVILSPYADPPRAIGFVMPNGPVAGGMQACAMTVDEVERLTGHDFFATLPDQIENELESKTNFNQWSRLK